MSDCCGVGSMPNIFKLLLTLLFGAMSVYCFSRVVSTYQNSLTVGDKNVTECADCALSYVSAVNGTIEEIGEQHPDWQLKIVRVGKNPKVKPVGFTPEEAFEQFPEVPQECLDTCAPIGESVSLASLKALGVLAGAFACLVLALIPLLACCFCSRKPTHRAPRMYDGDAGIPNPTTPQFISDHGEGVARPLVPQQQHK